MIYLDDKLHEAGMMMGGRRALLTLGLLPRSGPSPTGFKWTHWTTNRPEK